ncbi:MAG: hypothetical protein JNL18_14630 [Planctomycetaceae bacterium]|nr:hypothetical protein [Planctomycetaceae bacterium]
MLFASSLMKPLCASAILAALASSSLVDVVCAESTESQSAAAATAESQPADEAKPADEVESQEKKPVEEKKKSTVDVGGLEWRTDYNKAYQAAKLAKRMLLINLTSSSTNNVQASVDKYMATNPNVQKKLQNVVRLRLPIDAEITVDGKAQRLVSFAAFSQLQGGAGFVLLDLKNEGTNHYGHAVNVLPYSSGKYYHWQNNHLNVVLDLPPGTLTQRTMIWAVRTHPEAPQSTYGAHHPTLASGAANHSSYQASIGQQGHQNFGSRFNQLSGATGGPVSEVVAESWPGQNMIDSCIDCVQSWRGSSGHWRGVAGRHRAFGYDIRRGRNGIWYGTGIFAD